MFTACSRDIHLMALVVLWYIADVPCVHPMIYPCYTGGWGFVDDELCAWWINGCCGVVKRSIEDGFRG